MVNSHFPMVEIRFPYISPPKTQSVKLFCFDRRWATSSNLDLFLSKVQKQDSTRNEIFLRPNVSKLLIDHHDQQIVLRKARNFEFCFGTNAGTNKAKIEEISISLAILLGILRSLVSATWCGANKSNQRREERPIGSHAVKILRGLLVCARSRAACGGGESARWKESVSLYMHNWSIWCQGSSRTIDCVMAHSKTRYSRTDQTNAWRGKFRFKLFTRFSSVSRVY